MKINKSNRKKKKKKNNFPFSCPIMNQQLFRHDQTQLHKTKSGFCTIYKNSPINKERKTICNGLSNKLSLRERASHLILLIQRLVYNNITTYFVAAVEAIISSWNVFPRRERDCHSSFFYLQTSLSLCCGGVKKN
jgi:hypothetical protein